MAYSRVASQCGDDAPVPIEWPSNVPSRSLRWVRKFLLETCKYGDRKWGVVVPCAAKNSCNSTGHVWWFLVIFSLEVRWIRSKKRRVETNCAMYVCCLIKLVRHIRSWLTSKPWTVSVPNLCIFLCVHPLNCASWGNWVKPTLNINNVSSCGWFCNNQVSTTDFSRVTSLKILSEKLQLLHQLATMRTANILRWKGFIWGLQLLV